MKISTGEAAQLHVFSSFAIGGAQVRFATLANRLGREFRYRIFAIDGCYGACELLSQDIDYKIVELDIDKRKTLQNMPKLRRVILENQASPLVTYNWGTIEWAIANKIAVKPHIHIEDGFGPEESVRQFKRRIWARRFALAGRTTVVVPSRTLFNIASKTWKIPKNRLRFIPNGVDLARFDTDLDREWLSQFSINTDRPILGTVATLRPEKNLKRMLRAFRCLLNETKATLVIVGDGEERAVLENYVKEISLAEDVFFTGHYSKPERIMELFDVFLLSSDTEQMPFSILEAMAAGLPIAAVGVGDVENMVSIENKPYIGAGDSKALANSALSLLNDLELRKAIGSANRTKAQNTFSLEGMVKAYRQIFTHASGE